MTLFVGGGRHVFVVSDAVLGAALAETGQLNELSLCWQGTRPPQRDWLRGVRARVSALKKHLSNAFVINRLRRNHPIDWQELRSCDVLLIDWAGKEAYSATDPTEQTWNLARMASLLRDAGLKVGFVANPLPGAHTFKEIAEGVAHARDPVVMTAEAGTVWGVLKACAATWLMSKKLKATFRAAGLDLTPLFNLMRDIDLKNTHAITAYVYAQVAAYLAKNGVRPKSIIYTYENQGWERAMLKGIRERLPETRIVGYQHAPFAERYLAMYPSRLEIENNVVPDKLILMGQCYAELMESRGYPKERLCLGGSLRFEKLFSHHAVRNTHPNSERIVLCTSPIEYTEALDLVLKAVIAIQDMTNVRLVVNFHPVVRSQFIEKMKADLERYFGKDLCRIDLSSESSSKLLSKADVLLYNNSGTIFEAMFLGVPAIHVAVEGQLSFNKAPGAELCSVSGPAELVAVLNTVIFSVDGRKTSERLSYFISSVREDIITRAVTV